MNEYNYSVLIFLTIVFLKTQKMLQQNQESIPKTLSYRKERKVCANAAKENGYQHF